MDSLLYQFLNNLVSGLGGDAGAPNAGGSQGMP